MVLFLTLGGIFLCSCFKSVLFWTIGNNSILPHTSPINNSWAFYSTFKEFSYLFIGGNMESLTITNLISKYNWISFKTINLLLDLENSYIF